MGVSVRSQLTVLSHVGDESPWVIDAHLYYDSDTSRLWMTWGGHNLWISELHPTSGLVIDPATGATPASTEFGSHPRGVHTRILGFSPWRGGGHVPAGPQEAPDGWEGDEFATQAYQEGPSLHKHNGYWYACGSYGALHESYTIRCCRSAFDATRADTGARGPYTDKDGMECTRFYAARNRYGASMLLGPDGDQLVPGHPHMWREGDGEGAQAYVGYDYRREVGGSDDDALDLMGIRKLEFHRDWPTIWTPLTLTVDADTLIQAQPSAAGQPLTVRLRNTGDAESTVAFDEVALSMSGAGPPPPPPPSPSPTPPPPTSPPLEPSPPPPAAVCATAPPTCALTPSQQASEACACHYVWTDGCVVPTSTLLTCSL